MDIQIKKAIKAGNSSAVILPRSWLNKEVRVEIIKKSPEMILIDVINILKDYIDLGSIIGIYLTGSYARGEENISSDIDILVLTNNIDKEIINEGIYNILIVSKELLKQKLIIDLLPIGQMIKEARPLLNSDYLNSIKINVTKRNVQWYLDTTENKLKIIRKVLDIVKRKDKYVSDLVAYTLILRIRTLCIIESLIENRIYLKKDFIRLISIISGKTNAYERYLIVKNNMEVENGITIEETEALYLYLKDQLVKVKKLLRN